MPNWVPIRERWSAIRNRFDMNTRFGSIMSGVLPVVSLERNWPTEQLHLYGMNAECSLPGGGGTFHFACSLHNTSDENPPEVELLVWRVNAWMFSPTQSTIQPAGTLHLFSPLPSYNPHATAATIPFHAPWLQMGAEGGADRVQLSRAHGDAGGASALQVVSVGGAPTTSLGPILTHGMVLTSPTTTLPYQGGISMMEFQPQYPCPPLRVLPGRRLTVQTTQKWGRAAIDLEANFWWSERLFERGS